MWFKNLIIYRFTGPVTLTADSLEDKLNSHRFRHCGQTELSTFGWVSPLPESQVLVHRSSNCLLFAADLEERLLPASVVREAVEEKVLMIEAEQGRKVFKKEKEQLKDDVTLQLLPRAFTRRKTLHAYIDMDNGWLVINASSFRAAEELTRKLRKSLGSLPLNFMETQDMPAAIMTSWIEQDKKIPANIMLGSECELHGPGEDGGIIRSKRQELFSDEMLQHLKSGKVVDKLALQWKDALSCILQADLCIKRLKFSDELRQQSYAEGTDDKKVQADADFTLMALTLRLFIHDIVESFGGLVTAPSIMNKQVSSQDQADINDAEDSLTMDTALPVTA